jgi:asparagine synthase (glutamine-hydrolysing)
MTHGIFGMVDFSKGIDHPDEIIRTLRGGLPRERNGNSQFSYITDRNYLLGMERICNNSTDQRRISANGRLNAFCLIHGEINNYEDLKKEFLEGNVSLQGDLDLVIYLYRRYGLEFVKKLNGLFSVAILDRNDSSLILLNDRFGLAHQVYWIILGSRFYFATHLKALLTHPEIEREIDLGSLNLFLKYSYIPSPWTIFKRIRKLPPGHLLTFKDGNLTVKPYWEFSAPAGSNGYFQGAISRYKGLLKESISRRLNPNGKTGILLSGGLDSSANVVLAAECADQKLKTFSVGFEDPTFDERRYARIVSQHFNTEHFETVVTGDEIEDLPKLIWHLEEPYFEFGLFLTYKGLETASKEVDVVLGGEGADQLFGTGGFAGGRPAALHYLLSKYHLLGFARRYADFFKNPYFYDHDNLAFKLRLLWQRSIDLNNWFFYGFDQHELLKLYKDPKLAVIPRIFPDAFSQHSTLNTRHSSLGTLHPTPYPLPPSGTPRPAVGGRRSFEDFFLQTIINQDLKHYVNENVMVKSGRMADMLGLTLRETYLDTEVTDFLTSLDFPMKRAGGLSDHLRGRIKTKYLHRKAMEDILPAEILKKPKQGGFVPVMILLKNPGVRKNIYRHLLDSEAMKEYFRADYLKNLFESYERMQGRQIYWHNFYNAKANQVLFLLTFNIWHHSFIKCNALDIAPQALSDYLS